MIKKAIIFDNDGVLVNTERLYFQATREILAGVGVELDLNTFIESNIKSNRSAWHLCGRQGEELRHLKNQRNERYTELLSQGDLSYPGVHDVLHELAADFRLCIVTTSRKMHFEAIHAWTDYLPLFEFVITVDDVTQSKPHPEPYLKALDRLALDAADCLVIEDSYRGLKSACTAGIDCVVIRNEYSQFQDFSGAYRILNTITELPALVRSRNH